MENIVYCEITEAIKSLNHEDKLELKEMDHNSEGKNRREEILKNSQNSKKEIMSGKVKYYSSSLELRKALEND